MLLNIPEGRLQRSYQTVIKHVQQKENHQKVVYDCCMRSSLYGVVNAVFLYFWPLANTRWPNLEFRKKNMHLPKHSMIHQFCVVAGILACAVIKFMKVHTKPRLPSSFFFTTTTGDAQGLLYILLWYFSICNHYRRRTRIEVSDDCNSTLWSTSPL